MIKARSSLIVGLGLTLVCCSSALMASENRPFQSVMMGAVSATEGEALQRWCRQAQTFGASAAIVNVLPDPYPLHVLEQPDNDYVWFTIWGPSLDQYVSSDLTYGLYPEVYLARNRQALRRVVDAVKAHGMTPWLWCGEPRFFPERFYGVHPHLRGPRVDNPNCSVVPLYAPCIDLPEIHEHYRQMVTRLMGEFPEIGGMIVYANDSGTGICHAEFLYPGPNGPQACKQIPPGEKVRRLCETLLQAARKVNPDFEVHLGPYIWGHDRLPTLARGPQGVGAWTNGYFVAGGLEDCYANRQYPGKVDEIGHERARAERLQIMTDEIAEVKKHNRPYWVPSSAPMEQWLAPLRSVPNPYQTVGMLAMLRGKGNRLHLAGVVTDPSVVPFDVNRQVIQAYLHSPDTPIDAIVRDVAVNWAGEQHADVLCRAWRLCDEACRQRPMFSYSFGQAEILLRPIVPDPALLSRDERAYYHRESAFSAGRVKHPGADWPLKVDLRYEESYRSWMIDRFRRIPLPKLVEAADLLWSETKKAKGEEARKCLDAQARHIAVFHWFLRSQYNQLEAGRFLSPGEGEVKYERKLGEIVDDEIQSSLRLLELIEPDPSQFLALYDLPTPEQLGPRFIAQMKTRVDVMRRHRNDSPSPASTVGP